MALLDEVVRGAYRLEPFSAEDVERATRIMERYEALVVGLADVSVVVLAHPHATLDLLCTDRRHFRTLKGPGRKPFRLLPFDDSGPHGETSRSLISHAHRCARRVAHDRQLAVAGRPPCSLLYDMTVYAGILQGRFPDRGGTLLHRGTGSILKSSGWPVHPRLRAASRR